MFKVCLRIESKSNLWQQSPPKFPSIIGTLSRSLQQASILGTSTAISRNRTILSSKQNFFRLKFSSLVGTKDLLLKVLLFNPKPLTHDSLQFSRWDLGNLGVNQTLD